MCVARRRGIVCALLAAAFYALNAPAAKLLLGRVEPTMLAALLYLGCGAGMAALGAARRNRPQEGLTRRELPYVVAMVALDVAAPIALMLGLSLSDSASVSLLNNFEIVATSLIALAVFGERVSKRLWMGIGLVTASSAMLSLQCEGGLTLNVGALFVLAACVCWGFENNCTRVLSGKDPLKIVVIKGIFSGLGSLLVALTVGERFPGVKDVLMALLLGFAAYGLSIFFYIHAQRRLGAARTSAYYAVAPFIGVLLSWAIFREPPAAWFLAALAVMAAGIYAVTTDVQ